MCGLQLAILFAICSCIASVLAIESRVFGGYPLRYEVHKYLVKLSLQPQYQYPRYVLCSGSIIGQSWILTTAHCLSENTEILFVYHQMQYSERVIAEVDKRNFLLHPEYVNGLKEDIALMKTSSPITFNDYIQPVKLTTSSPRVGQAAIIAGYGESESKNWLPKEGAVTIVSCPAGTESGLLCSQNTVCAGWGDSGGALISTGRLIGVTAASSRGALELKSCVTFYVDVSSHLEWIQEIISSHKK